MIVVLFAVDLLHGLLHNLLLIVEVLMLNVITIADHSIIGEYIVINYPTSTSAQENLFKWQLVELVLDIFGSSSTQAIQTQYCI